METYTSEQTVKTPHINFDPTTGNFEMRGKSVHEDSLKIYQPMFQWLDEYSLNPAPKTKLDIQLDYFNTSSSKCITDLLKKLEQISLKPNSEVVVKWLYDEMDDEMRESGEEYKSIIKSQFDLVSFSK